MAKNRFREATELQSASETFFAPCPRGLESVLGMELEGLGAKTISLTHGGVSFTGPFELCYRTNLQSRIASRILWLIGQDAYRHEQDLYEVASALPWHSWFAPTRTIKVKVSAQHCRLKSLQFVTLRIKDAVCDRFTAVSGARPSVETRHPDIRIDVFLDQTNVLVYLDTSGDPLFKRGLRQACVDAPLRENLAAGIVRLSGWTPEQPLLDPMCGGGTILMEAGLIAKKIAPGLGRRFAFEKLNQFDGQRWRDLCESSRSAQHSGAQLALYGCDRHSKAIQSAQANLQAAGLGDTVKLKRANVLDIQPPAAEGMLITNPPYGVRLGQERELAAFYPQWGDALKQRFPGWRAYIFTADRRLPTLIGLAASRRTPLFNGALECRLFAFTLVSGSMRRHPTLPRPL